MDQLKAMRIFAKVIDEGSFAGAARAMDAAPAVITRSVAELEQSLGCRLLNRTTRTLALTDAGTAYLERVRSILEDVDDANARAADASGEVRGTLRLAAPQEFLTATLARELPRLLERHPALRIHLAVSSPLAQVPDENADVTILIHDAQPLDGHFVARLVAQATVVMCATPTYLERKGRPRVPADLKDHTVLVPDSALARKLWEFHTDPATGAPESVSLAPQGGAIAAENAGVLVSAARGHFGIAGSLSFNVAKEIHDKTLVQVLPNWSATSFRVYAAMPTRKHLPLRTRALIDFLIEIYGGGSHDPWLPVKPA